ncbi:MAG: DUF1062 domain-containing protein [Acetatifactor sp.]|nr:DUF1062 domain-containing protein [Acetatifactor sp.]
MSYFKKIEYEIVPRESFRVIRNCSGCGRKAHFTNTKKFRVNANGNKLDVWLIYQCEKCRHTLNLAIYERQRPASLPKEDYRRFLSNDEQFAEAYGRNIRLFQKNKAEVDFDGADYDYVVQAGSDASFSETSGSGSSDRIMLTIHNPYGLKIRPEKQVAEILELSRSQVEKRMREGNIVIISEQK